jgi:hypothetical protein
VNNNIKKIIEKIKSLSLETINKNLLLIALISLVFRHGSFYNSSIPKPFEIFFVVLFILNGIYLIKNNKIKDFFLSVPKKILIAIGCLFFSIFIGWAVAILFMGMATTIHTFLEFGAFSIGITMFFLVSFYAKNDQNYGKKYFYALLLPIFYIIFILYRGTIAGLDSNSLLTFMLNPNVLYKILLIPTFFFISKLLCELKNKWMTIGYIIISSLLVAVIFLTASRGGIVSLFSGAIFIWLVFSVHQFNWKKFFLGGIVVLAILSFGFLMIPNLSKEAIFNKIFYTASIFNDNKIPTITFNTLNNNNNNKIPTITFNTLNNNNNKKISTITVTTLTQNLPPEARFIEWPIFFKYVLVHPFGVGPNSHADFNIVDKNGVHLEFGPNNTYLLIWLWGGLLGIGSFLYIIWSVFKMLWIKLKNNFNSKSLALLSILFALSISITFDASLSFYWFFIILALSLRE